MRARVEFKLSECYIGWRWRRDDPMFGPRRLDVWVCLLPCLPIHIWHRPAMTGRYL